MKELCIRLNFFGKINEIHKMDELTNKKRKNR